MANGTWDVDWEQIYGAGQDGGEGLESIVSYLFDTLKDYGAFGDEDTPGIPDELRSLYIGGEGWEDEEYTVENLISRIETLMPTFESNKPYHAGMGALKDLLGGLDIGGASEKYGKGISDIETEMEQQVSGLTRGYTGQQKGRRYGAVGTGKADPTGSRQQYEADIYGLQHKQSQLKGGLQEEMESGFFEDVQDWLTTSDPEYIPE